MLLLLAPSTNNFDEWKWGQNILTPKQTIEITNAILPNQYL